MTAIDMIDSDTKMSTAQQIQEKVDHLSADEQAKVLEYLEWIEATRPIDDKAWGELGARLAAETLHPDDFSDWEQNKRE